MGVIVDRTRDLFFGRGNRALDISRVGSFIGLLTLVGLSIADFVINLDFDPMLYGTGFAAFAGGAAGWMHFKDKGDADART